MSNNTLRNIALFFITAFFASCSSSTSTAPSSTQTPHTMLATVDGASWSSAMNGIYASAYAIRRADSIVTIIGIAADSSEITIMLPTLRFGSVGTDSLGKTTGNFAMYSSSGTPDTSRSYLTIPTLNRIYSGFVTITSYDTTKFLISGQFQFVGHKAHSPSDSVTVTSGSFYQLQFAA